MHILWFALFLPVDPAFFTLRLIAAGPQHFYGYDIKTCGILAVRDERRPVRYFLSEPLPDGYSNSLQIERALVGDAKPGAHICRDGIVDVVDRTGLTDRSRRPSLLSSRIRFPIF